jgi:hypothetical protein
MGDLQRGNALALVQLAELAPEHLSGGWIDGGERLIEEEDRWLRGKRPGQRNSLLLAAAEPPYRPFEQRRESEQGRQFFRSSRAGAVLSSAAGETVADVVPNGEVREEMILLLHETQSAPLGR